MQTLHGMDALAPDGRPAVVTVGFFDGVHLGHQRVLERAVQAAGERGLRSVAVTFDRHPREILTPGAEPRLLTTVERKASLIEGLGIDVLFVLEFTAEFSRRTAEEFVTGVLREALSAEHVVVGANFSFGHRAAGDIGTLRELGPAAGFTSEAVELLDLGDRRVSSTSIREALGGGDLEWPRRALGRRFVLDGEVVAGAGRGKGLGFPTANLRTWPRLLLPGSGIYAGAAQHAAGRHIAAISVGTNPTFGSEPLHVEAFLLDYAGGELRGEPIAVEFWARLRDELRFDSAGELTEAIAADVARTREVVTDASGA